MNEIFHAVFSTEGFVLGTLVPFLFVLTVVVFVHEMGHYLIGRWCGIGVKAFSIGFGPELFGFNDSHGTRWKLSAIPLGGYVKFVGDMNATSSQPSAEAMETLSDAEREVAFHTQPIWKRAATVVAGPLFNFLLTIAVFAVLFSVYGRSVLEPTVAEVRADSPAARAGILPGDRFVGVDGSKIETFADVQRLVSGRAGDAITFTMLRDGKEVTVTATPELMEQEDALGNKVKVAVIGVVNNTELGQPRLITYSPVGAVGAAVEETGHVIQRTGQFLQRFVVRPRGQMPAGRPDQDRQDVRAGGKTWLRVAGSACGIPVSRDRNSEPSADSPARRRPPLVLRRGGCLPTAGIGTDDGDGLSGRTDSGAGLYGFRVLE